MVGPIPARVWAADKAALLDLIDDAVAAGWTHQRACRVLSLEERRARWRAPTNDYQSGALWRYARNVGPAWQGAVTHPGAAAETHVYADI